MIQMITAMFLFLTLPRFLRSTNISEQVTLRQEKAHSRRNAKQKKYRKKKWPERSLLIICLPVILSSPHLILNHRSAQKCRHIRNTSEKRLHPVHLEAPVIAVRHRIKILYRPHFKPLFNRINKCQEMAHQNTGGKRI